MCMPCSALYADTGISDAGAIAMGGALEKNSALVTLSLKGLFCFRGYCPVSENLPIAL